MQNSNTKRIILTIISLGILTGIAYVFFLRGQTEEIGYTVTNLSGSTLTNTESTGAIVTDSGAITTNRKNIQIVAYLSESTGKIEKTTDTGVTTEIKDGEVVTKNDTISTGENSSASLIFIDNSVVRLDANSRITITKKAGKNIELTLLDGDVWARVLKPLYDTSFFTIKTADVSA